MSAVRIAIGTVIVAALIALAIWFASWLDAKKSHPYVTHGPNIPTLVVDLPEGKQDDLLISCNEAEFQTAFQRLQTFVHVPTGSGFAFPGGPLLIARGDVQLSTELQPPKRALVEVMKRHSPHRVVLVAHDGCLYYDTIAAWVNDPSHARQRALADLARARSVVNTWFPSATVEVWYGERRGQRQIQFQPVSDDTLEAARRLFGADSLVVSGP